MPNENKWKLLINCMGSIVLRNSAVFSVFISRILSATPFKEKNN